MPVVSKTDFVNTAASIDKDTAIKLLENDGFRQNAVIVNTDRSYTVWVGGLAAIASLKTVGVPIYPGQSFATSSISELYAIADDAVGANSIALRIQTEEESKSFTTGTMDGS